MPRGERTNDGATQARRNATLAQRRAQRAVVRAHRALCRHVAKPDRDSCLAWLKALGVALDASALTDAQRLSWIRRARKAVAIHPRPFEIRSPRKERATPEAANGRVDAEAHPEPTVVAPHIEEA